jgi:membrane protease subunit HflK
MAWNEPGGGGPRDPWDRNNHKGGGKGPDFDDMFKRLRQRMGRFGGGGGGVATIVVALLLAWLLLSSATMIDARQAGVVLRFGQYTRTLPPGFHFKLPSPIEQVIKVQTAQVRSVSDSMQMLTKDENIVAVDFNVQWQVSDARKFLFAMKDPEVTIGQAAEAAVRAVVGANTMDTILSGQGAQLVADTRTDLQKTLDGYDAGLIVTEVSFQNVSPPKEVKDAFDDVNKAREDKQRIENEAQAYASQVVPVARGAAARIAAQAAGYKAERIANAQGDVERFNLLLTQYHAAPEVTRKRLWLETMEGVLATNRKVLDTSGGRNIFYLPVGTSAPAAASSSTTLPGVGAVLDPDASPADTSSTGDGQ